VFWIWIHVRFAPWFLILVLESRGSNKTALFMPFLIHCVHCKKISGDLYPDTRCDFYWIRICNRIMRIRNTDKHAVLFFLFWRWSSGCMTSSLAWSQFPEQCHRSIAVIPPGRWHGRLPLVQWSTVSAQRAAAEWKFNLAFLLPLSCTVAVSNRMVPVPYGDYWVIFPLSIFFFWGYISYPAMALA
jgi:hypothetical protein